DLLLVDRRVVGGHLGPGDALGDPPVEIQRPPPALVDASLEVSRAERVAPLVELRAPEIPGLVVEGLDPVFPLAGVAAEDDLVEDVLAHEAGAVPQALRPVAACTLELLLGLAREQFPAADDALLTRRGPRHRRIDDLRL